RPDRLGLRVRAALQADPALAAFTLAVTGRPDRSVRLWGAVPTRDLADRAAAVAGRVPGVGVVVSELEVRPVAALGAPAAPELPPPRLVSSLSPQALVVELPPLIPPDRPAEAYAAVGPA